MTRDIDRIIALLGTKFPDLKWEQLTVMHPGADDDGVWYLQLQNSARVLVESWNGMCPFLIESELNAESVTYSTVEEVVDKVAALLETALRARRKTK